MRGLTSDERGRLTLPDVLYVLMTVAFIGALWPVVMDAIEENHAEMSTGAEYIYLLVLPLGVLVLLSVIYLKATAGGAR